MSVILLDDGGVMNDNSLRGPQWQRLVGEFFPPLLGGMPVAWAAANYAVVEELLAPDNWEKRIQAATDYASFDRKYQRDWLMGMCEEVGIAPPEEEKLIELAHRATAWIIPRVRSAFPGAVGAILELHRQGYTLHTASGGSSTDLDAYLTSMGVRECFGRLYGPDLINTFKFRPSYYERIFADLGILPAEALVVDDNHRAIKLAAQAGAATVLVHNGTHPESVATHHIGSLAELPSLLERWDV